MTIWPSISIVQLQRDHVDVHVDVQLAPVSCGVRVAEGDVDAGQLLVLEQVAGQLLQPDIRADRKLAGPPPVLRRVQVIGDLERDARRSCSRPRRTRPSAMWKITGRVEHAVLVAEVVAEDMRDEGAVDRLRAGEGLALGQVAPLALLVIDAGATAPSAGRGLISAVRSVPSGVVTRIVRVSRPGRRPPGSVQRRPYSPPASPRASAAA